MTTTPSVNEVRVATAARLHLGFLDLHGGLGRKFGGLGLSIDGSKTRLVLTRAGEIGVEGPEAARAERLLRSAIDAFAPGKRYRLQLAEAIPAHAGLGSGTQLALAVAVAVRRMEDVAGDAATDAAILERGARSGIGAGLFEMGGFVVDGGRTPDGPVAPTVARLNFPTEWRVLLVYDRAAQGLHGEGERAAFATLPAFTELEAGDLCRRVLMQVLPALAERDLAAFGAAISHIQRVMGDHFAPAQGGRRFVSAAVEQTVVELQREGAVGGGQTSWGPTGFAFAGSAEDAARIAARVRPATQAQGLEIDIVAASNDPARVIPIHARMA
jgi:beta-ribofuranosylaminobenzene 5'-phosphate synthase